MFLPLSERGGRQSSGHVKRHIHAGKSGRCFCTTSLTASLGSSKELVRAAKKQLLAWGWHVPCLAARAPGWGAGFSGCPLLSTALPAETRTQGAKVPPQIPSKINDSTCSKSIGSPWDTPRFPPVKAVDANTPLPSFLPFQFPFLAQVLCCKPSPCLSWTQLPLTHLKQHP